MLLCDDHPMLVDKIIAKKIGLNESIVLQQIHYWLKTNEKHKRNFNEGRYWTYNTINEWQEEFCFWSKETVKSIFKRLRELGLIVVGNFNKMKIDRTLWYSIDYERLNDLIDECKTHFTISAKCPNGKVQNAPMEKVDFTPTIPEISTEITSEIYNQSINQEDVDIIENNSEVITMNLKQNKMDRLMDYKNNYKIKSAETTDSFHVSNVFEKLKGYINTRPIECYVNYSIT